MNKIVVFLETYHAAGSDTVAKTLIQNLDDEICLFVNSDLDQRIINLENLEKQENIQVFRYSLLTSSKIPTLAFKIRNEWIRFLLRAFNLLIRYPLILISIPYFYIKLKKIKPDIILSVNGGYPAGEFCRSILVAGTFLPNTRLFNLYLNKPARSLLPFRFMEYYYDKFLDRNISFICDSQENALELNRVRNISKKVNVISNGLSLVNLPVKKEDKKIFNLLNIAIFEDRKNQLFLIDVIYEITKKFTNFKLTIVGYETESGYLDLMNEKVRRLNLEPYIEIHGFNSNLESYYLNTDLFLFTSKKESFPMVILDSLRYSIPIISSNVGGISKQVVNNFNGFLIDNFNKQLFVEKTIFLLENNNILNNFGQNSLNHFKNNFTTDIMIDKYKNLFKKGQ